MMRCFRLGSCLMLLVSTATFAVAGSLSLSTPVSGSCGEVSIGGVVLPSPEDTITALSWDWGDGKTNVSWFPASHTYARNGIYTVNVTAKSQAGAILTGNSVVSIQNAEDALCDYAIRVLPGSLSFRDGVTSAPIHVALLDPSGTPIPIDSSQVTFT